MSDKADHLIERAAALLRSAVPPRAPSVGFDPETIADGMPGPLPAGLAAPNSANPGGSQLSAPALLVPPSRPTAIVNGGHSPAKPAARPTRPLETVTSAAEIAASPSRPIISLDTLERAGLLVARNKRTRTAEEYRIVIGRMLRALHEEPEGEPHRGPIAANVVMVTSARPGEGKSFSALNLAGSIAQNAGESVLLVDVDPKMRPMSDQLGLGQCQGFMDLIAQPDLPLDELVLPTELPNLSFLPLGSRVNRRGVVPSDESASSVRPTTPAIHRIAQRYPRSLIILDAPPCLSTSDPHTLAPHVGQVVLIVEAERTQRNEVEAAIDLVRTCPTLTMLLNKVRMSTNHTFGAYDYFGSYT
ncbi:MAG: XrtA-associated tyrosine autokinase [Acetobacteraceae bacterium]